MRASGVGGTRPPRLSPGGGNGKGGDFKLPCCRTHLPAPALQVHLRAPCPIYELRPCAHRRSPVDTRKTRVSTDHRPPAPVRSLPPPALCRRRSSHSAKSWFRRVPRSGL